MNLTDFVALLGEEIGNVHLDSCSEYALAEDLWLRLVSRGVQLCSTDAGVWIYDSERGTWELMAKSYLLGLALSYNGARWGAEEKTIGVTFSKANGIVSSMAALPNVYTPEVFDAAPMGVAFSNGFLLMHGGKLKLVDHSPKHFARSNVGFEYEQSAGCPKFLHFLSELFKGDRDAQAKAEALGEFVGVAMLGQAPQLQRCMLMLGIGSNGKSSLLDLLRLLLPESARCSVPPDSWLGFRLFMLDGKLLNFVDETPKDRWESSETFKNVVTGGSVLGERKNRDPYEFRPRCGHIFACNELPGIADVSKGLWRRWLVLKFNRDFDDLPEDQRKTGQELIDELSGELPGICAWALRHGLSAIARRRYTEPTSHGESMREWKELNDSVAAWVADEAKIVERGAWEEDGRAARDKGNPSGYLYNSYVQWCDKSGRRPVAVNRFGQRLGAEKVPSGKYSGKTYWGLLC